MCRVSSQHTTSAAASTPAESPAASESAPAEGSGEVPKGDGTQTIYLVSKGFQHRFWQAVNEGAKQAADEYGYKIQFVGPDDETKVTQQLDQLQAALDAKPIAIGLAALDTGAAEPILQKIEAANIPLVAFDSGEEKWLALAFARLERIG